MFLLGISIVLTIVLSLCFIGYEVNEYREFKFKKIHLMALLPLLICLLNFATFIPANNVGIKYSPFSGVKTNTLSEGFHIKGFFDKIYKISTEVQSKNLKSIYGQTKDAQYLTMVIDIKYTINSNNAFKVFKQFKTLNNVDENLISPMVQRSIETITTKYNVIEVLGEKRNEMYKLIEIDLKNRLGINGIDFYSITFLDTDAGEAIENAIKNEAVAKKSIETAEQERKKVEIDSKKRIIEAEANKQKALIDAETKVIQANAEAESNKIISLSLNENVLRKMEMDARMKHGWITANGVNSIIKE